MNPEKRALAHNFLRTFIPALTYAHQYTTSHQHTTSSINIAYTHLLEAIGGDPALPLMMIDDRIVVDEEPLEDALYISRFLRFFKSRGIQHLRFSQGITVKELTSFIEMLTIKADSSTDTIPFPSIEYGKVGLGYKTGEKGESKTAQLCQYFKDIPTKELNLMMDVYEAVKNNRKLPNLEVRVMVGDIIAAIKHESLILRTFSPVRVLDEYTFTHSTNVCILNLAQAMALGIKDELLHDIGVAALLHDTGKIFVPEEVLNKEGKLTDKEWEMIRQHPRKGAEYLIDSQGIPPLAVIVAFEHHLQYDNSGYPKVSKEWRQNLCSQMTSVADVFDALRTKRIYRDSMETKVIADRMMNMAGTSLNPLLTKNFLVLMKKVMEGSDS
jgi:HD-GYP domain-containing protein (c-di-GMP phosphodiesterase class II)